LRRVRLVHSKQAPDERWDWDTERESIRKMLDRWKPKWVALKSRLRNYQLLTI
jgi:hypothetical protein